MAYQERINGLWDLVFGTRDSDDVIGHLGAGKFNLAIPFLLQFFDLSYSRK
jgi:hypothetical protein